MRCPPLRSDRPSPSGRLQRRMGALLQVVLALVYLVASGSELLEHELQADHRSRSCIERAHGVPHDSADLARALSDTPTA